MRVCVAKADSLDPFVEIEDTIIEITDELPKFDDEGKAAWYYDYQATRIATALQNSLPQATFERLIVELLRRMAGVYRGRSQMEDGG